MLTKLVIPVFLDGQFKSATGGHFQLSEGGQFHWNFHPREHF